MQSLIRISVNNFRVGSGVSNSQKLELPGPPNTHFSCQVFFLTINKGAMLQKTKHRKDNVKINPHGPIFKSPKQPFYPTETAFIIIRLNKIFFIINEHYEYN